MYSIDNGSSKGWTLLAKQVDCLGDQVGADRIHAAELQKLCLNIWMKTNLPHLASIRWAYIFASDV